MAGYLDNRRATAETIVDDWLHTGDIGYYDEEENVFIVDRVKELIKVKGLQVEKDEEESLLSASLRNDGPMCACAGRPRRAGGHHPADARGQGRGRHRHRRRESRGAASGLCCERQRGPRGRHDQGVRSLAAVQAQTSGHARHRET